MRWKSFSEIKKKQVHQCCHSSKIGYLSISTRIDLGGYKLKKKTGDGYGEGRTSSHGLWLRIVLNALCLWSDVSRGHDHLRLHLHLRLRLLDLCPLSEIVSLLIEIETYDDCGSEEGEIVNCYKKITQAGLLKRDSLPQNQVFVLLPWVLFMLFVKQQQLFSETMTQLIKIIHGPCCEQFYVVTIFFERHPQLNTVKVSVHGREAANRYSRLTQHHWAN